MHHEENIPKRRAHRPIKRRTRGLRNAADHESPLRNRVRRAAPIPEGIYLTMVSDLKELYKISIRRWRKHMSGVAYELTYQDGRIKRLISAPRPRSPVSACIFLHEVGHHAIGFRRYAPRCLEEYFVWQWVFREMANRSIPIDERVHKHYRRSMHHYVKLARRESHHIPHELHQFTHWPG